MSDDVIYTYMKSPTGAVLLARSEEGLTHISFQEGKSPVEPSEHWRREDGPLLEAI